MPAKEKVSEPGLYTTRIPALSLKFIVYFFYTFKTRRMTVYVNNEPREISAPSTLQDMLATCEVPSVRGLAIAVNNQVIARATWDHHPLRPGDRVMLIRASKGG